MFIVKSYLLADTYLAIMFIFFIIGLAMIVYAGR